LLPCLMVNIVLKSNNNTLLLLHTLGQVSDKIK
jgi:hypothetical protein